MATEIGFIKGLIGSAIATAADGSQRTLQVGDKLFVNEIVSTGAAGAVEIEFTDGSIMDLGRNSQAILDNEVLDPQQATQAQTSVQNDVDALQQALLDGADPTQVGDATAAGAGTQVAGNEGHTPVTVEYLAPQAPVTSGFDTTGPILVLPEIINEIYEEDLNLLANDSPTDPDEPVVIVNDLPSASDDSNTVFEDQADFNSSAGTGVGFIDDRGDFVQQVATGNVLANDDFGDDGAGGLVSVTYTGSSSGVTSSMVGGVTTLEMADPDSPETGPIWTLTVEANGEYTFSLNKPYVHSGPGADTAQESFQYTIQDGNGDTASAALTLNIVDDVPTITGTQPTGSTPPTYEFTITNHDEVSSAGFHNSYGYYIKDPITGEPTTGVVIWDDVHDKDTSPVTVTGFTPDQVGFFIIPNGDSNSGLEDNTPITFSFVNGQWQVFSGTTALVGNGANVYFDDASLNKDSQQHVVDNTFTGNQNWEDKPIPGGDKDFNDVNINVEWKVTEGTGKLLTVDETALADGDDATAASATVALAGSFAITAGADGLDSVGYTLGLVSQDADSGLVDTGSNDAVLLRTNAAGDVEGYVADGVVFTLTVNATTGEVTLTQLRAVVHGNPADNDESTTPATINDGLIVLTATVTDGDGDSASDSIDVGTLIAFEDDGPTAVADNTVTTNEDTPVVINVLANDNVGADNATITDHTQAANGTVVLNDDGTFTYTPSANYSGADSFSYTLTDGDGDTSTAIVSIGISPVADAPTLIMSVGGLTTVATGDNLVINGSFEDVSGINTNGGKVTNQPIADGGYVARISIPGWTTISGPTTAMEVHDQSHAGVGTTDGVHYMDLGASPGNTSIKQEFNSLTAGQTYQLSFDFRDKAAMQESGQAGQDSGVMNVIWNGAVIATVQGNNTEAWDSLNINVTATGNDSLVFAEVGDSDDNWGMALDNVQLHDVAYNYELSVFGALTDVDGSESLSGVTISNLPDGATVVSVANADGTYDPGTLTITSNHELSATEVNTITGEITSTDGASTATTLDTAKVVFDGLDATGQTADLLIKGDGGANSIIGGAGDDIIFGGAGDDVLTGGAGSDTFVWNQADLGTIAAPAKDTVTDFDVDHDVLNLSDLLSDPSVPHTIEGIATGGDNHLQININDASGSTVQQIDLQGVAAGPDVNATLNSLLDSGAIHDGM